MKLLFSVTIILINLTLTTWAQKKEIQNTNFDKYQKSTNFISQQIYYSLLPELKAERGNKLKSGKPTIEALGAAGDVLLEYGGFLISEKNKVRSNRTAKSSEEYPVVFNSRSQKIGIVVGTLIVRMQDVSLAESLVEKYSLGGFTSYSRLNTVVFSGKYPAQVLDVFETFSKDSSVISVEIEVLENLQMPL